MFDNIDRNRYYGLRIGDTVVMNLFGRKRKGIVIHLDAMDNNSVIVQEGKEISKFVAEWCKIEWSIEDKLKSLYK